MGATINVVTSTYGGVNVLGPQVTVNPHLPQRWRELRFALDVRGVRLAFRITHHLVHVRADRATTIQVCGQDVSLTAAVVQTIDY
nr:glycosyl hydrolase family 65 protein [Lacticaseibacillus thailandensis]